MNNNQSLMVRTETEGELSISFVQEAETLRAEALESSAMVCKVEDASGQIVAVEAQKKLLTVIRAVEKSRKAVKEPLLKLGRLIDEKAAEFVFTLNEEGNRVAALVNTFQERERARAVAELQLQNAALAKLEREKNEKIACASTIQEQEQVREEYSEKNRLASVPMTAPIPKVQGQMARPDFDVVITDIHALYRAHPNCVKLTPLFSEIKALAAMDVPLRGVTVTPVIRSTIRTPAQKPPMDV